MSKFKVGDIVRWIHGGETHNDYIRNNAHRVIAVDADGDIKIENDGNNFRFARFFELDKDYVVIKILNDL